MTTPRHRRTGPLIDAAETTQEQLEHTLEYYHATPPPFDARWRAGAAVPHAARMRLPATAAARAERFIASSPCSTVVTRDAPGGCTAEPHARPWRRAAEPRANPCSRSPRRHPRQTARNDLAAESSHGGASPESRVQQPMQQPRRPPAPVRTARRPLTCASDPQRPSCDEFTPKGSGIHNPLNLLPVGVSLLTSFRISLQSWCYRLGCRGSCGKEQSWPRATRS